MVTRLRRRRCTIHSFGHRHRAAPPADPTRSDYYRECWRTGTENHLAAPGAPTQAACRPRPAGSSLT